ncbi:sulfite reductase flavoprotein subunit alpha [Luteimonas sp. MC1825]|uniref:sulfite reductase subunit alpha n=1 Tax=Luteimonas sp. MC1825 TaxID=2761107 RepID=UPI00160B4B50|nr:sulfite reductase flavoprotein subunit alpha [Luteimonas sp. MC1825]MBB6598607.1 sulfite reductase flavoprotein subunit alpha [Luteimonas sp. MC1825]QOC88784.1 sulfite reductase flavoprotein subunit alpha [Luteimonas sp. MC1825]
MSAPGESRAARAAPRDRARVGNWLALFALAGTAAALLPLHGDRWWIAAPPPARSWLAALVAVAWVTGSAGILWRARRAARTREAADAASGENAGDSDWLVLHASQTGYAEDVAARTTAALRSAGQRARPRGLAQVDLAMLAAARRVLFIASTTGEGDPPDPALAFVRDVMRPGTLLPGLQYAVLALGDRSYRHYCGFGHQLERWLRDAGGEALFDLVEVDNGDPAALRHWQHHLGVATEATGLPDWSPAEYQAWTLAGRVELNPGSPGAGVYELRLAPPAGAAASWRAGDIAEIGPRQSPAAVTALLAQLRLDPATQVRVPETPGVADSAGMADAAGTASLADVLGRSHLPDPAAASGLAAAALAAVLQRLPHREYSIASIPSEGDMRLLLRRMLRPDGTPGIGSGWLCDHVAVGGPVALRIRANRNFRGPDTQRPMLLIGNGTGIAGLRAHLAERIAAGARRNWLLFGERHADRDFHFGDRIAAWLAAGELARLDLAFSRDSTGATATLPAGAPADGRAGVHDGHVQDALRAQAARLRAWVDEGAAVYVCGSLRGMAPGVDGVLRDVIGRAGVDAMLADGRYRRDVY